LEKITLTARARTGSGKSYTRKARLAGWTPAAYYGVGITPINIEVHAHEFTQIVATKQHNKLVELVGEGIPAGAVAVIRETQKDPVKTNYFYHVDFQNVDPSRPVKSRAFLKTTGASAGVKLGGILNQVVYEIDVEAMVDDIPESVELDITALEAGGTAMASQIKIDPKVKMLTSPARVVARILGKAKG